MQDNKYIKIKIQDILLSLSKEERDQAIEFIIKCKKDKNTTDQFG